MTFKNLFIISAATCIITAPACSNLNKSKKGAIIGAGAGAAVGAGIGKLAKNTALGAIIGAGVGGVAGGLIGKKMDQQAKELEKVPGAEVSRVGEGINITFNSGVLFAVDATILNEAAKQNMQQLVTVLNKYPDTYVRVEGHTDASGTSEHNLDLSQRRANTVADFLKQLGVASSRIQTAWYGESQPKVENTSTENMAKNRRVEFAIFANEKMKEEAKKQTTTP